MLGTVVYFWCLYFKMKTLKLVMYNFHASSRKIIVKMDLKFYVQKWVCIKWLKFRFNYFNYNPSPYSFEILLVILCTYPWSKGNQLENSFKGEAHGKCEVHVGEQISQQKRSSIKLVKIYKKRNNKMHFYSKMILNFMYKVLGMIKWR